jgi:hypothetical protein
MYGHVLGRGYNIGIRLIDEFLAKSGVNNCQDFRETAEVIAKVAFKMFLGVNAEVAQWNADNTSCSLLIYDNPLTGEPRNARSIGWRRDALIRVVALSTCRIRGAAAERVRRPVVFKRALRCNSRRP